MKAHRKKLKKGLVSKGWKKPGIMYNLLLCPVTLMHINPFYRTLSDMNLECVAAIRQLHLACMNLDAKLAQESSSGVDMSVLEKQLKDKLREAMQLQGCWNAEKVELNSR